MTSATHRRGFLLSLPALAMARRLAAQSSGPPIRARALNHVTLTVSDPKRSLEFYQGLFGLPILSRQGSLVALRIGDGPQHLALSGVGPGAAIGIHHFCMAVEDFSVDRTLKVLAEHGVKAGPFGVPMTAHVSVRRADSGGAKEGTPELFVGDPDGIVVQLQDPSYCGGAGVLGNVCAAKPERAPVKGRISVRDFSHVTMSVPNPQRSNAFFQEVFGLKVQAFQGPTAPLLGVGEERQFVMFAGGGRATAGAPRPIGINHVCLSTEGFNPDRILTTLADYGIKPRGDTPGPAGPLTSYVSLRMENRGGAKEGTPELYFTDPDGILIQLQDVSYCGGAGPLGNVCP